MNVATILSEKGREVFTVRPNLSLADAAKTLDDKRIGALVVTDDGGAILGVLSERDITCCIARRGAAALTETVETAMTSDVVTTAPSDTIDAVMARMTDRRIRHLPVVDGGRLAGIVSIGDVVKRKIADAEAEAEAMKSYIATG
jgi:CBS domain-containing protein